MASSSIVDAVMDAIGERENAAKPANLHDFDFYSPSLSAVGMQYFPLPRVYLGTLRLLKRLKSVAYVILLQQNSRRLPVEGSTLPWDEDITSAVDETHPAYDQYDLSATYHTEPTASGRDNIFRLRGPKFYRMERDYRTVVIRSIRMDCALLEQDVEIFRIRDPSHIQKMAKDAVDVYRRLISCILEYASWILARFRPIFNRFLPSSLSHAEGTRKMTDLVQLIASLDELAKSPVDDVSKAKRGGKLLEEVLESLEHIEQDSDLSMDTYRDLAREQRFERDRLNRLYGQRFFQLSRLYANVRQRLSPDSSYSFEDWKADIVRQYAEASEEERDAQRELAENVATINDLSFLATQALNKERLYQGIVSSLQVFWETRALPHAISLIKLLQKSLTIAASGCADMVNWSYLVEHGHKQKVQTPTKVDTGELDDEMTVDWVINFYDSVLHDIDRYNSLGGLHTDYDTAMTRYRRDGNRGGIEGWEFLSRINDAIHDAALLVDD